MCNQDEGSCNEERDVVIETHGPKIMLMPEPTQALAIQRIVSKTNLLLASHRDWLANRNDGEETPQLQRRQELGTDDEPLLSSLTSLTTTTTSSLSLITPAPLLRRQANVLPECSGFVSQASSIVSAQLLVSITSISSTASASIIALNSSLSSVRSSAASVQSLASGSVSSASAAAVAASSSATSAISSISASASSAVSSASAAAVAASSSASLAVASAQSVASQAMASATVQIAQAQASVSQVNQAAQATITASRLAATNNLRFALVVTFSVLGSSLLTILVIYLCLRTRRRRKEKRQLALKEKIRHNRDSDESTGPSLSDFPAPGSGGWPPGSRGVTGVSGGGPRDTRGTWAGRDGGLRSPNTWYQDTGEKGRKEAERDRYWADQRNRDREREDSMTAVMLSSSGAEGQTSSRGMMSPARKTWAPNNRNPNQGNVNLRGGDGRRMSEEYSYSPRNERGQTWGGGTNSQQKRRSRSVGADSQRSRKTTLVYDPDRPEEPPVFQRFSVFEAMKSPRKIFGEGGRERKEMKEERRRLTEANVKNVPGRRNIPSVDEQSEIGTAF